MPYKKMEDAPASWKELDGIKLTLAQVNWIAKVYDALKPQEESGKIKSAAAIAISQFKKSYKKEDDKWVEKTEEEIQGEEIIKLNEEIILGELSEVEIKEVIKEEKQSFDVEKFVMEEMVTTETGSFELHGEIVLEEKAVNNGTVKGKMPMVKFNEYTGNNNRYTEECWDWLATDVNRLTESTKSKAILDMYPTHRPSLDAKDPDYFLKRCGVITSVSKEENIGYVHFETLKTGAGPVIAEQLQRNMINGCSLRAVRKEVKPNNRGGIDHYRMRLLGCDFTDVGSMPFTDEESKIILEETKQMDATELKTLEEKHVKEMTDLKKANELALEENKKLEKKLIDEATARRKSALLEYARTDIGKEKGFGEVVKANVLEECQKAIDVIVSEQANDEVAKMKIAEFSKNQFDRRKKESAEAVKITMEQQKNLFTDPNVISTLSTEARKVGLTKEMTGGSTRLRDLILANHFNRPMYKDGKFVFEEWEDRLKPLIAQQTYYMQKVGSTKQDWMAPGGKIYETLTSEEMVHSIIPHLTLEANEGTTSAVISTNLPTEVSAAIIYAAFPQTIALQIAQTGDMKSSTKDIFEIGYPSSTSQVFARGKHMFGAVFHGGLTALVTNGSGLDATTYGDGIDDGALAASSNQYANDLYIVVVEAANADTVCTWTGLDENGDAATWTVTVLTTDAAGTIKKCTPTNIGQKCTDISAIVAVGMSSAGQFIVFIEKPITGATAGSQEDLAYLGITKSQATANDYDLGARLDIALLEDMQLAMRDTGGGLDYLNLITSILQKAIVDQVDRKILYEAVDDCTGGSQTYANGTLPSGYTQAEWDGKFAYYLGLTTTETQYAGNFVPNFMVWSLADEPRFMDWLRESWIKYDPSRTGIYLQSRALGNAAGCDVYASPNARRSRVLVGTKGVGLHYYVYVPFRILGPQWVPDTKTQGVMVHSRSAVKITQPRTLGKLTIS